MNLNSYNNTRATEYCVYLFDFKVQLETSSWPSPASVLQLGPAQFEVGPSQVKVC